MFSLFNQLYMRRCTKISEEEKLLLTQHMVDAPSSLSTHPLSWSFEMICLSGCNM